MKLRNCRAWKRAKQTGNQQVFESARCESRVMTDQHPQVWLGYPNTYLPTLCGPRCTLRLCTHGWYTSKTDGS